MNRTAIQYDDNTYFARSETVTTWTDDDGIQWVGFVPTNGYNPGRAHRVRTDRVVMVELDDKPAWGEPGSVPGGLDSIEPARAPQVGRSAYEVDSVEVDVIDYPSFAKCAREAGLDTLLLSDGAVARVTGQRATVESFLQAAGYEKDDVR